MFLEINTLAAFDKNNKVVRTWNYELVTSKDRALTNIKSKCDEKGYTLRVCFNEIDKDVEAYLEEKQQNQLKDFTEED